MPPLLKTLVAGAVLALALPGAARAQWTSDAQLHGAALKYRKSLLWQSAAVGGVYGGLHFRDRHSVEANYDYSYFTSATTATQQHDLTLAYTFQFRSRWRYRLGLHTTASDDSASQGNTAFASVQYTVPEQWSAKLELAGSDYRDIQDVFQAAPSFGVDLHPGPASVVRVETWVRVIALAWQDDFGDTYHFSAGNTLSYLRGRWSLDASAWAGSQTYALAGDGFVVYSGRVRSTGGLGAGVSCVLGPARLAVRGFDWFFEEHAAFGMFSTIREADALGASASLGVSF